MCFVFFFNDTATTEIYTLSLHDALPICGCLHVRGPLDDGVLDEIGRDLDDDGVALDGASDAEGDARVGRQRERRRRSEEHTSELQSRLHLVCRLLLEKKKKK